MKGVFTDTMHYEDKINLFYSLLDEVSCYIGQNSALMPSFGNIYYHASGLSFCLLAPPARTHAGQLDKNNKRSHFSQRPRTDLATAKK